MIYSIFLLKARVLQNIFFSSGLQDYFQSIGLCISLQCFDLYLLQSQSLELSINIFLYLSIFIICLLSLTLLSLGYQPSIIILLCSEQSWWKGFIIALPEAVSFASGLLQLSYINAALWKTPDGQYWKNHILVFNNTCFRSSLLFPPIWENIITFLRKTLQGVACRIFPRFYKQTITSNHKMVSKKKGVSYCNVIPVGWSSLL